jgi:hypothetical protein
MCEVLVGKPKRKRSPRGLRHRRKGGNWMDLTETGWVGEGSGFTWLRIRTGGGHSRTLWWTFRFWRHVVSYLQNNIIKTSVATT